MEKSERDRSGERGSQLNDAGRLIHTKNFSLRKA